ncbi:acetyl-CoA synthetase-like protein [Xylaria sp. CBS 124048]|nr:acetyl-CoA synthetase-like protein [Xylaria sp. CBS 124048]
MALEPGPRPGRRLLPLVLRERTEKTPNRLYAAIPKTSRVEDGFVDITFGDISRCIDFMAHWIHDQFGGPSDQFETLSYIGIADLRGVAVFLAAVTCGYKLLVPSPRNPPATTISLLGQTKSTKMLFTSEVAPIVKPIHALSPALDARVIPSFREMMESSPAPYPFTKTFEEARDDPIVVLTSSGSTGLPKPIVMTHGTFAAVDNQKNLPKIPGRQQTDSTQFDFENTFDGEARVYMTFPFFHLGGFLVFSLLAIFRNAAPVLGPPNMIPDATLLKSIMAQQRLKAAFLVPSIIEQLLAQDPGNIELFRSLEFISISGAPLDPAIGERLSKVVSFNLPFGATEFFVIPELDRAPEDWEWHEFHPDFNFELQLYDAKEGLYELVLTADEESVDFTPIAHNLPGIKVYHTKDLFTRHPTRHELFKYHGRLDDIIVLANGEKFSPGPLEMEIQTNASSSIKGALVIGNNREQSSLIVEPATTVADDAARLKLLDGLWPLVQKANTLVLGPGRVQRGKLLCASADKPFVRTAKGTIVRRLTEKLYESEIEDLYSSAMAQARLVNIRLTKPVDKTSVANYIREVLALTFPQGADIALHEDFYAHGLDSIQTLEAIGYLKHSLSKLTSDPLTWITPHLIYRYPTIADLAQPLVAFLNDGVVPQDDHPSATTRMVDEIVAHYVEGLPTELKPSMPTTSTSVIAIIGSTGYLGTNTLLQLLKQPDITRIYCLNRASDAQARQCAALTLLDKSITPLLTKLTFLQVSLGQPHLGLEREEDYNRLQQEVDVLVYNAWRLDFGLSIRSFHPFLSATRDIINLAHSSPRSTRIIFISSISSVAALAHTALAPEEPVSDASAALAIGYAQSKLAAETILTTANRQSGIPISIVRICQLGGPSTTSTSTSTTGTTWAEQPWLWALLRTAKSLRRMPDDLGHADWLPIDTAATMLQAFILRPAERAAQVYNLYPPHPAPWSLVCDLARDELGVDDRVPLQTWVKALRDIRDPKPSDVATLPALKILEYFESIASPAGTAAVSFATEKALRVSQVDVPPLDKETLRRWIQGWNL